MEVIEYKILNNKSKSEIRIIKENGLYYMEFKDTYSAGGQKATVGSKGDTEARKEFDEYDKNGKQEYGENG